jgi:hypothetical protein
MPADKKTAALRMSGTAMAINQKKLTKQNCGVARGTST